jgi:hypothetical protein
MPGPADELKREHVRLGRQLTVDEAIPFLDERDPDAAAKLRALGPEYQRRPIFVDGQSGLIRRVTPAEVPLGRPPVSGALKYVHIDAT